MIESDDMKLKAGRGYEFGKKRGRMVWMFVMKHKRTLKTFSTSMPQGLRGRGEKTVTSREGCKEATSPRESWVSYSKKVKCMVLKIQGILLATDSDFRRHNERVS